MKTLEEYKGFYIEEDEKGCGKIMDAEAKLIKQFDGGGILVCKMWIEIQTNPVYKQLSEEN